MTGVPGEMYVGFASNASCTAPLTVSYGATPALGRTATARGTLMTSLMTTPLCIFGATMTDLAAGTAYYQIEGDDTVFDFAAGPTQKEGINYLVMGDYGAANDVAEEQLIAEVATKTWSLCIYSGDMACQSRAYVSGSLSVGRHHLPHLSPPMRRQF